MKGAFGLDMSIFSKALTVCLVFVLAMTLLLTVVAFAAGSPVIFDFDTGTPSLTLRQNTPLGQTSGV